MNAAVNALPGAVDVAIVGGGIQGLALAYHLAEQAGTRVLVLDAGYFQGGASGRNGTMIRAGFMGEAWTALYALAGVRWYELSKRLRRNVMYSRRGYLLVAEKAATAAGFDAALATHAAHGVRSRRVGRRELQRLAPALAAERACDALYLPDSGVCPHHAAMEAYLAAARGRGVDVRYHTPVDALTTQNGAVTGVRVGSREVRAARVVLAAAADSIALGAAAGAPLPGYPMRLECSALEPVREVLRPGVAFIDRLCYVSQTARGEVVGGAEVPERPQNTLASDLPCLAATARVYAEMLPRLSALRVLRQWAGVIHATADFGPLVGPHPARANLWITSGWSYGYAGATAAGELLARSMRSGRLDPILQPFAVDRFERRAPVPEGSIVLAAPDA